MSTFDRLHDEEEHSANPPTKPFWTLDFNDDKVLLDWLRRDYEDLRQRARPRIRIMRRNLAAYRGISYKGQSSGNRNSDTDGSSRAKNPRFIVNHLLDMVEQHVSRITKFRPDVAAEPASQDFDDKNIAKVADELMRATWYREEIDSAYQVHNRVARIMGESYLFALWNPDKGPLDKGWIKEQFTAAGIDKDPEKLSRAEIKRIFRDDIKEIKRIPLVGTGGRVEDGEGNPLWIDKPVRIGEVEYKLDLPWNVFPQRKPKWEDVEYLYRIERDDVENVKGDHPDLADQIKVSASDKFFDAEHMTDTRHGNEVTVIHFWHRSNKRLDQGRYIKFTADVILENGVNEYEWNDQRILPVDRLTDLDTPAVLNGEATVRHGRPMQAMFNNSMSMVARNQFLMAHPKWFYQWNTINPASLANQATLVPVKGGSFPELRQASPTGGETFRWMDLVKENFQQIMGIFGTSRGDPPPGVKAGVAIQFLDEQENERANVSIAKHNASIRHVAILTLAVMGVYYDEEDGRLEELLGKTRAAQLKFFRFTDLTGINDVRVHTASALPRQKAARIQTLLDLSERYPEELDARQVLDMLDLGQADKFISISTTAVRSAESEDDQLMREKKMLDPAEYEDHLMHWKSHMATRNDVSFKINAGDGRAKILDSHIKAHEMFMITMAKRNPLFMEFMMQNHPNFPAYMKDPEYAAMTATLGQPPPPPEAGGAVPPPDGALQLPPQDFAPGLENAAPVGPPPTPPTNAV